MRLTILAALAALLTLAAAPAHASFTQDDRYFDSRAPAAAAQKTAKKDVIWRQQRHARKAPRPTPRITTPEHKKPSPPSGWGRTTIATTDETIHHAPRSESEPAVFHGRPAGAPRAWCGFFLGKLLGLHDRALWLARNWAHVGSPAGKHVGAIVVWKHHVGKITAVRADGAIRVLSGNDKHAVRDRWRSARGVIAYRAL